MPWFAAIVWAVVSVVGFVIVAWYVGEMMNQLMDVIVEHPGAAGQTSTFKATERFKPEGTE